MAQILKGQTFADGDLVTGLKLNNIVDLATLLPNAITDQTALTAFDVQSTDYFLIYDASATALRKASVDDLFRSGQTVKFSSISGVSGSNLVVSIAGGYFFTVNGNTNITGDLVGTGLVQGSKGKFSTEVTIPADTTANRPASPVAGSFRYNTTTALLEVYNGTAWVDTSVLGTNNTFSGTNTFSNTVNITGAVQFNGTAVYALSAITEETITTATGSGVLWTSSSFTKPSDEIWVFEVDAYIGSTGTISFNFLNTAGTSYNAYITNGVNSAPMYSRWVVNAGTTLTVETVRINNNGPSVNLAQTTFGAANKFRIYKYRTA